MIIQKERKEDLEKKKSNPLLMGVPLILSWDFTGLSSQPTPGCDLSLSVQMLLPSYLNQIGHTHAHPLCRLLPPQKDSHGCICTNPPLNHEVLMLARENHITSFLILLAMRSTPRSHKLTRYALYYYSNYHALAIMLKVSAMRNGSCFRKLRKINICTLYHSSSSTLGEV